MKNLHEIIRNIYVDPSYIDEVVCRNCKNRNANGCIFPEEKGCPIGVNETVDTFIKIEMGGENGNNA